jgi:RNA-directed DNA polymerase
LGEAIKNLNGAKQEVLIRRLNPILRGFANYYKGVVSKETFSYIAILNHYQDYDTIICNT